MQCPFKISYLTLSGKCSHTLAQYSWKYTRESIAHVLARTHPLSKCRRLHTPPVQTLAETHAVRICPQCNHMSIIFEDPSGYRRGQNKNNITRNLSPDSPETVSVHIRSPYQEGKKTFPGEKDPLRKQSSRCDSYFYTESTVMSQGVAFKS